MEVKDYRFSIVGHTLPIGSGLHEPVVTAGLIVGSLSLLWGRFTTTSDIDFTPGIKDGAEGSSLTYYTSSRFECPAAFPGLGLLNSLP